MASIATRKNGSRFIGFIDANGKRRTIYLGKVPKRYAESVKVKVEDLVCSSITGHAPSDETSRWLAGQDDRMIAKLARVGLTQDRHHTTLENWLLQYQKEREGDLKPESLRKLKQTGEKLLAYFAPQTSLRQITVQQSAEWREHLKGLKLSDVAIKTHSGNAKGIIEEAVRRKLIEDNPFQYLKSGPTPSRYNRYVTPDEISQIIEACPNSEWRLLFGLARYAGLRIPSESHPLTWANADWQRTRLTVFSPKTEHHAGHEQRIVPINSKLMRLLQDRYDECAEGEQHLVKIQGKGAVRRQVGAIWKRSTVEPWDRLWLTLRQSCEKQWAMKFPQFAVSKWMGHSITVSGRHCANDVPDELFDKAAELAAEEATEQAQRNAQRKMHEGGRNDKKRKTAAGVADSRNSSRFGNLRNISEDPEGECKWSRGDSNPRPVTVSKPPLHV